MDRIDKVICNQLGFTRKEVKRILHKKRVEVNGQIIVDSDYKVDLEKDNIKVDNQKIEIKEYVYLVLNKPKGYVSATKDNKDKTVLELVPEKYLHRDLFPAGRLDKDTTGLMLITDDGVFAHEILSPKKHVPKTYLVEIDIPLTKEMQEGFQRGVVLKDGVCKASSLEIIDTYQAKVTLTEGRYHQIKRMFGAYQAKVLELKRLSMGKFTLPIDLNEGEIRELTKEELSLIKER